MKKILFILLLSSFTIGCQDCSDIQIYGEQEDMLLDSIQRNNVKTGCDVCDEQIKNLNINAELEKLNTQSEFSITKGSYSYYNILSKLNGVNYSMKNRRDLLFTDSNFKDSLIVTQLKDSIKISFIQKILGGCIKYVPNIINTEDSFIIRKVMLPDLDIRCLNKKMSFGLIYYMSVDVTESILTINRESLGSKKLFFQHNQDKIFNIPIENDTIYFEIKKD
ncbi:MAG: hypothetical protein H6587_06660 [Flavobacteriales bacterium]|nr:hypothetical protein [Flavobacteriales bacterium]MCB9499669.1 hypothetical protein [Erysipelotrichaceae bacterium]